MKAQERSPHILSCSWAKGQGSTSIFRGQRETKLQESALGGSESHWGSRSLVDCILCKAYLHSLTRWPNALASVTCIEDLNTCCGCQSNVLPAADSLTSFSGERRQGLCSSVVIKPGSLLSLSLEGDLSRAILPQLYSSKLAFLLGL